MPHALLVIAPRFFCSLSVNIVASKNALAQAGESLGRNNHSGRSKVDPQLEHCHPKTVVFKGSGIVELDGKILDSVMVLDVVCA